ncbi:NADPH oxidase 1 isoform X1 [Hyla sarda]|uniref:NADPH oxidase 1 isoform X1 n=2 Tax=Hyla sarda TaxID=327740 RepID=UPI0024C45A37|nr:NADPH oxidase 1 isoform X1 [Hyla sarda]XP_056397256.1 NADPH oxidase 1 isoform X1 [Hyla sarda]XP_056397257.1 NADPH oxidase 1 isoform X1 [Hyla sarda]XP_056397258.1 NADPH oxidase 1 isoform X1 [Hyla sarda]XP_056397259.1 NADPH oxidase 1 isoform X1 [Hyla sarda]XP_056397260.1 NADPH oxidase 1 isoform X1 [Hyla sarda]
MGNWIANHWFSAVVLIAWLGINIFLFIYYFMIYETQEQYAYTRVILGSALAWARGSAACLNFNCLIILLPVCRNLLSFLRGTCSCCRRSVRKLLDNNLAFHKILGYTIALMTAVHTIAHLFNVERFYDGAQSSNKTLEGMLSSIGSEKEDWVNPIRSKNETQSYICFTTIAGVTGVVITLALILMITSSTEFIRRCYFEVFWYTHHLFIIFFAGLLIHGVGRIVRGQTTASLSSNSYDACHEKYTVWKEKGSRDGGEDDEDDDDDHKNQCFMPSFQGNDPMTWKWIIAPIIIYILERFLRFCRSQQRVVIIKTVSHPSKVLEIQMQKRGFRMEVGQYIFINCPSVSRLEWHPFTLTSAPEEDMFSVHIRSAGDWTESLIKIFHEMADNPPRLEVDGPFGTASEDVFKYEVSMLVGAGIGVTPFASILKSIWYKLQNEDHRLKTKKIYFYWICRETGAFAWFADLLRSLEQEMITSGKDGFLNYRLFLTSWDSSIAGHAIINFDVATDAVTGLKQKTSYGRPIWENEFSSVADAHPRSTVGVFLCGPQALGKTLQQCCHQYSSMDPRKVQFYFNKENF